MIGDICTKPLGSTKFPCLRNTVMNCNYYDFGPVNMDDLIAEHNKRIHDNCDVSDKEAIITKTSDTVGSGLAGMCWDKI